MEMSGELEAAFNEQITMELGSAIAYVQMSAYLEGESLVGMASWMRIQAEEERAHALRFVDFVLDRGNRVTIGSITAPRSEFKGALGTFEAALEQERAVTAAIAELYRHAQAEADVASFPLLQEFLTEQVEEEATMSEILDRLGLAGEDGAALLDIDRELGARLGE